MLKTACLFAASLLMATALSAQMSDNGSNPFSGDPDARPPVTKADIEIVRQAKKILNSPSKWNRVDTRICPKEATTFSLYCALEKATNEVSGNFQHRGAATQEARFLIDEITAKRDYQHRLMDYNNDPTTTFTDIQKIFRTLEDRIRKRLKDAK